MYEDKQLNEVITVKRRTNPFVMLDKTFLEDDRLSFKAKGILAYLLSRPDGWQVIVGHLITVSKEGKSAVYAGLKELKECGYYEKVPVRNAEGTKILYWESTIYELPHGIRENEQTESKSEGSRSAESERMEKTLEPEEPKDRQVSVCTMEEDSFPMQITEQLIDCCKNDLPESCNLPDTPEKKQVWAVYIYQLLEAGYSEEQIQEAMDYATKNAFWKNHIKSTKKFKEKFTTLTSQLAKKKKKVPQTRINPLLTDFREIENPGENKSVQKNEQKREQKVPQTRVNPLLTDFQEIENRDDNNIDIINNNYNNISVMSSQSYSKIDETDETDITRMIKLIHDQIGYEDFKIIYPDDQGRIDEIVMIMLDVLLTKSGSLKIDGMDKPIALVKSNFSKIRYSHIELVLDQYKKQTSKIQKKHRYIVSMLYHAVMELDAHYTNLVEYHMAGGES